LSKLQTCSARLPPDRLRAAAFVSDGCWDVDAGSFAAGETRQRVKVAAGGATQNSTKTGKQDRRSLVLRRQSSGTKPHEAHWCRRWPGAFAGLAGVGRQLPERVAYQHKRSLSHAKRTLVQVLTAKSTRQSELDPWIQSSYSGIDCVAY
jgi:hypothetical protein